MRKLMLVFALPVMLTGCYIAPTETMPYDYVQPGYVLVDGYWYSTQDPYLRSWYGYSYPYLGYSRRAGPWGGYPYRAAPSSWGAHGAGRHGSAPAWVGGHHGGLHHGHH